MKEIKIVSFDVEGTLVTTDFSYAIWFEAIPRKYAAKHGISLEEAKQVVRKEYEKIGDQRVEWYDVNYWFNKFSLGSYKPAMEEYQQKVQYYPEVMQILSSLNNNYRLIATSGSPHEFLEHLLRDINHYFFNVFSSISDYRQTKTIDFYNRICTELTVLPEHILHVGDNWQFDFLNAREAGLRAFFLDRNHNKNKNEALADLSQLRMHLKLT